MFMRGGKIQVECTLTSKNARKSSANFFKLLFQNWKKLPPFSETPFSCVDQDTGIFKKYFAVFPPNINLSAKALSV